MLQQINGRDTIIDYISDKSIKLVVYSDSTVCSSCFGEAFHLSNGATFAKNIVLLAVAGLHLWNVFRQRRNPFNFSQVGLTAGVLVVAVHLFGMASGSGITIPDYEDVPVFFMDGVVRPSYLSKSVHYPVLFDTESEFE